MAHVSLAVTEVVLVMPLSTTPTPDIVVLQSSADCVLQLVRFSGLEIVPLIGIFHCGPFQESSFDRDPKLGPVDG